MHSASVFFCIGCQKSGTTLLARALDQHPRISCLWESYILRSRSSSSLLSLGSNRWADHGFAEADIRRWSQQASPFRPHNALLAARDLVTGSDKYRAAVFEKVMPDLLADFAERCEADVVGDKWPWYIDYIDLVLETFPNARFIYNVRDPRGLWNSGETFKNRGRGNEILHEMLDKDKKIAPYLEDERFMSLRYEDLICEPEATCEKLYAFLGCDYQEEYLTYNPVGDPYPKRWSWIPEAKKPFDPALAYKWKKQMSAEDKAEVNEMAGWFIEKYAYEA